MSGEIVKQDKAQVPITSGNIEITSLEGAYRVASMLCRAGWAGSLNENAATVAVLHGQTLGLSPMQAVQSIAVINGRPSLWGDACIGMVLASGQVEDMKHVYEGEGDKRACVFTIKRKGVATAIEGRFSVADAKRAGLWGKKGPWEAYPDRMLYNRARAYALRDAFADILRGVAVAEEAQDLGDSSVTTVQATVREIVPQTTTGPAALDDDDKAFLGSTIEAKPNKSKGDENAQPPENYGK